MADAGRRRMGCAGAHVVGFNGVLWVHEGVGMKLGWLGAGGVRGVMRFAVLAVLLGAGTRSAGASPASLYDWVRAAAPDASWARDVRRRFGGAALASAATDPAVAAAKAVLYQAFVDEVPKKQAIASAFRAYRGVLGVVPEPIAVHYERLVFQGRPPAGRPIDLALAFDRYFEPEIAVEVISYWQAALREDRLAEETAIEVRAMLRRVYQKMRPLVIDKLRLLVRAKHEGRSALRVQLEAELAGPLADVFSKTKVGDARRAPFDRLEAALAEMGQGLSDEDLSVAPQRLAARQKRKSEGAPAPTAPAGGGALRAHIKTWLGTPYAWGGESRGRGTDCSGFVKAVFSKVYRVFLPRVSRDQYQVGRPVRRSELRAGDLVFFDTRGRGRVSHVGVYVSDGRFAHASTRRGVRYDRLAARYYRRAYLGARRVL